MGASIDHCCCTVNGDSIPGHPPEVVDLAAQANSRIRFTPCCGDEKSPYDIVNCTAISRERSRDCRDAEEAESGPISVPRVVAGGSSEIRLQSGPSEEFRSVMLPPENEEEKSQELFLPPRVPTDTGEITLPQPLEIPEVVEVPMFGTPVKRTPIGSARSVSSSASASQRKIRALIAAHVRNLLPVGAVKICILGDAGFEAPETERLVKDIAVRLGAKSSEEVVVLTCGQAGVQAAFADGLKQSGFTGLFNLLPAGGASGYGFGRDVVCDAEDADDVWEAFVRLGQIHLTFEGGPRIADLANGAFERGSVVLTLGCTGGASMGEHGLLAEILERPSHISSAKHWQILREAPYTPEIVAAAAEAILGKAINRCISSTTNESITSPAAPSVSPSSSPQEVFDAAELERKMAQAKAKARAKPVSKKTSQPTSRIPKASESAAAGRKMSPTTKSTKPSMSPRTPTASKEY